MPEKDSQRIHWAVPIQETIKSESPTEETVDQQIERRASSSVVATLETARQAKEIWTRCIAEGFDEGAVVIRRCQSRAETRLISRWGVVLYLNRHPQNGDIENYKPLRVRWFDGPDSGSLHKMDELFIIHEALTDEMFNLKMDCQDPPWVMNRPTDGSC